MDNGSVTQFCDGRITLVNADCMDYMRSLPDDVQKFTLACTDPDYGVFNKNNARGGTWARTYGDSGARLGGVPDESYFTELKRISENQIVWGGNYFDFLPPTRCFLVWDKKDKMPTMADCEYAWTSFNRNAKVFCSARNPGGISKGKRIIICQKPIQLYMWCYELFLKNNREARIIDTHMGSASSAIAAYETGYSYVGIEINPDTYNKAVERVRNHIETHSKHEI